MATIIEISKIRTGRELSVAQPDNTPARERAISHDALELPSFETLDQIALKRELKSTVDALERTKAERTELLTKQADLVARCDALEAERTKLELRLGDLVAEHELALAKIDHPIVDHHPHTLEHPRIGR